MCIDIMQHITAVMASKNKVDKLWALHQQQSEISGHSFCASGVGNRYRGCFWKKTGLCNTIFWAVTKSTVNTFFNQLAFMLRSTKLDEFSLLTYQGRYTRNLEKNDRSTTIVGPSIVCPWSFGVLHWICVQQPCISKSVNIVKDWNI